MQNQNLSSANITSIFKYGTITKEEYTKFWIDLIEQMEKNKAGYQA